MILLDTHVLLWMLGHEEKIGPDARATMQAADAVHYSAVSIAEITIERMIGRITVPQDLETYADRSGLLALPLRPDHSSAIASFPELKRHDPFDRLRLAQAQVERYRFLTADHRLLGLGRDWIIDAAA